MLVWANSDRGINGNVDIRNREVWFLSRELFLQAGLTRTTSFDRHLKPGHLSLCVFHGNNKSKVVEGFINNDVVLTTYRTLESDCKARGLLQKVMWFRVVLDEGIY